MKLHHSIDFPRVETWTLQQLPELNHAILARRAQPELLVEELNRTPLAESPLASELTPLQAQQWMVYLGLFGSSVGRHFQEREPALKDTPQEPLHRLRATRERIPFLDHVARVAERTGAGHPPRDAYASLVRWNVPTVEVHWRGQNLGTLPGAFGTQAIRTYTGVPSDSFFLEQLKKAEALEAVANETLLPLLHRAVPLTGPEARERLSVCVLLLDAVHQLNLQFTSRGEEGQPRLEAPYFMDILRQFAVHWVPGDIPPSGALDPEFLMRDFFLGTAGHGYEAHVRRLFPAMLEEDRRKLETAMCMPSLPAVLSETLGFPLERLPELPASELLVLVRAHPWLVPCYRVLRASARVSSSHLMLTKRFLFNPMRARARDGLPDGPIVSNWAGTTGLVEQRLEQLHRKRAEHALQAMGQLSQATLLEAAGLEPPEAPAPEELLGLARFAPEP
ncbi:hypothetical protein F0U60_47620 [Archangium minus]|uniref:Uncharacterized protein n=1 Tax=Archangium minus TaxID=83450 RepID=A0ABY9X6C7_9BACT|nr:hypothetical protein F0U60_47620 [Archangium minus]